MIYENKKNLIFFFLFTKYISVCTVFGSKSLCPTIFNSQNKKRIMIGFEFSKFEIVEAFKRQRRNNKKMPALKLTKSKPSCGGWLVFGRMLVMEKLKMTQFLGWCSAKLIFHVSIVFLNLLLVFFVTLLFLFKYLFVIKICHLPNWLIKAIFVYTCIWFIQKSLKQESLALEWKLKVWSLLCPAKLTQKFFDI